VIKILLRATGQLLSQGLRLEFGAVEFVSSSPFFLPALGGGSLSTFSHHSFVVLFSHVP
jgi:hypothetical protein